MLNGYGEQQCFLGRGRMNHCCSPYIHSTLILFTRGFVRFQIDSSHHRALAGIVRIIVALSNPIAVLPEREQYDNDMYVLRASMEEFEGRVSGPKIFH